MSETMPKLKWFLFLSFIAILINLSACCVALVNSNQNLEEYVIFQDEEITTYTTEPPKTNITVSNFIVATATSFIPFVDIINLAFLNLDIVTTVILGIIILLIGAIKSIILFDIVVGHLPFFDV